MSPRDRARSPHPALDPHAYYRLQDHVRWADSTLRLWEAEARPAADGQDTDPAEYASALEAFAEDHGWRTRPLDTPGRLARAARGMELRLRASEAAGSISREEAVRLYRDARERALAFSRWIPSLAGLFPADAEPALGLQDIRNFFGGLAGTLASRPISAWLPGILAALDEIVGLSERVERTAETPGCMAAMSGLAIVTYLAELRNALERYQDDPRGGEREYVFACRDLCEAVEARYRREEAEERGPSGAPGQTAPPLRVFRLTEGEIAGFRQALEDFEARGAAVPRSGGGTPPRDSRPRRQTRMTDLAGIRSGGGTPSRVYTTRRLEGPCEKEQLPASASIGARGVTSPDKGEAGPDPRPCQTTDGRSARVPSEEHVRRVVTALENLNRECRHPPRTRLDLVEPHRERKTLKLVGELADALRPLRPLVGRRPTGWPIPVEVELARVLQEAAGFLDFLVNHWQCQPYTEPALQRSRRMRQCKATFQSERRPRLCQLALLIKRLGGWISLNPEESKWSDRGEECGYEPALLNGPAESLMARARGEFSGLLQEYWTWPRYGPISLVFDASVQRRLGPALTGLRSVLRRAGVNQTQGSSHGQPEGKTGESRAATPPVDGLAKTGGTHVPKTGQRKSRDGSKEKAVIVFLAKFLEQLVDAVRSGNPPPSLPKQKDIARDLKVSTSVVSKVIVPRKKTYAAFLIGHIPPGYRSPRDGKVEAFDDS